MYRDQREISADHGLEGGDDFPASTSSGTPPIAATVTVSDLKGRRVIVVMRCEGPPKALLNAPASTSLFDGVAHSVTTEDSRGTLLLSCRHSSVPFPVSGCPLSVKPGQVVQGVYD